MSKTAAGTSLKGTQTATLEHVQRAEYLWRPDAAKVLLILALAMAALAYMNTLRYQFVYDDLPQIVNNPQVHTWAHWEKIFVEHVWSQLGGQPGNYYRPLFVLWLMVNYSLFGLQPMGWHATAVLLHLALIVMVYVLMRRILQDRLAAAIGAVIWALHPTHIETVAWVSGSPDSLLGLFLVGSFLTYAKSREDQARRVWWIVASIVLYALGMLSKETGLMLPLLLLAYDWLLAWRKHEGENVAELIRRYFPYAVAGLAYLVVRRLVLHHLSFPDEKPWTNVFLTLPTLLWFYVKELFWPVNLSVFHDTPLVQHPGLMNFVLPLAGVLAAIAAAIYLSRRSKIVAFGCWWFAVLMIPPIMGIYAFIPEDLVHDRYLYLPLIGFAIVCAWAIRKIPASGRELFGAPSAQMALTLLLGVAMAVGTSWQNMYWTNDVILYAHAVQVAPDNVIAINHLANEFYKRKDPAKAMTLYQRSLELKPHHWATHFALGITWYELGNYPEAQKHLETAIPLLPGNSDEYYYLGLTHLAQRHYAEAEPLFRKALSMQVKPGFHWALARALEQENRLSEARDELSAEWAINPAPPLKLELERVEKQLAAGK